KTTTKSRTSRDRSGHIRAAAIRISTIRRRFQPTQPRATRLQALATIPASSPMSDIARSADRRMLVPARRASVDPTMALHATPIISDIVSGYLIAAVGLLLFSLCFYLLIYRGAPSESKIDTAREPFHDCIAETQSLSKVQINNLGDYIGIYNLCNDEIFRT